MADALRVEAHDLGAYGVHGYRVPAADKEVCNPRRPHVGPIDALHPDYSINEGKVGLCGHISICYYLGEHRMPFFLSTIGNTAKLVLEGAGDLGQAMRLQLSQGYGIVCIQQSLGIQSAFRKHVGGSATFTLLSFDRFNVRTFSICARSVKPSHLKSRSARALVASLSTSTMSKSRARVLRNCIRASRTLGSVVAPVS